MAPGIGVGIVEIWRGDSAPMWRFQRGHVVCRVPRRSRCDGEMHVWRSGGGMKFRGIRTGSVVADGKLAEGQLELRRLSPSRCERRCS
jgi:hypothetical protein